MMSRSTDGSNLAVAVKAPLPLPLPLPLPRKETDGSSAAASMLLPPSKPIRQTTAHAPRAQDPPTSQRGRAEDHLSLGSSFHLSFSREESFAGSLTAPSKPVRQVTLATAEEQDSFLTSRSGHSSGASSSASTSRFDSLFDIVTRGDNEASVSSLRFDTEPPSQPTRQVTASLINPPPPPPQYLVFPMPPELAREASGALKKPRVTNCKFSKASLFDDDDDDDDVEDERVMEEEAKECEASGTPEPRTMVEDEDDLLRSKSHRHLSLGMSLSCMTFRTAASSSGPPPLPVRQISSDGLVVLRGRSSSKKGRGDGNGAEARVVSVPQVDRLCAAESAASASPPSPPVRQVSRPLDVPHPRLAPNPSSMSCGSLVNPPSQPKRQVTQPRIVPLGADASCQGSKSRVSRSGSQTLTREPDGTSKEAQVHPPSKPVRQVSSESFPAAVVALPPLPIAAPRSDSRRSRRRSSTDRFQVRPSCDVHEATSTAGQIRVGTAAAPATAPLTPLPSSKAPILVLTTRMMSPSSSSNASSSSSSRSSAMRRHSDHDRMRQ